MTTLPAPATVSERLALPAGLPGRGAEGGAPITAGDLLGILRRKLVRIVVLATLFCALVVGGFVVWWVYFPLYRATALIECITNVPEAELTVTPERLRLDEHERFVATQAVLLKSPTVLLDALAVREVQETDWYKSVPVGEHLLELTDDLGASPVRGTNFLQVSIECRKKTDPKTIVNNVVNRWLAKVTEDAARAYARQLAGAREDLANLERQIEDKRNRLRGMAERLPAGAAQGVANVTTQQVLQYGEQVGMLNLELSLLEQYRAIYRDETIAVTAEDRQAVEQDAEVSLLVQRLFILRQQQEADRETFGPEHQEARQLEAQINAAEAELDRKRTQKLNERRAEAREAAETAYESSKYALFLARENLAKAEGALQDQDRLLFDYANLTAEIEQDLEYRVKLRDYVEELNRVVNLRTALKLNVSQYAIDPLERSSPSLLWLPIGFFFALLLAVGSAVAAELLDTSVRTTQDIVRHLEVPLLGAVPHTDDEEVGIEQVETALQVAPRSMVAEAFRRIRANLQFSAPAAQQRSILVSSPHPADGKTTVACNLALAVAQGGRRVLLVDANFRRPGLKRVFPMVGARGLSNILVGESGLADCVAKSGFAQLDLLGTGPTPPNPAELLGSEAFRAFLDDATTRYDQVFIDSPPVLLASDPVVVATAVDGAILVVRARENSRGAARRACGLLTAVNARLFGAILNAAQATRGGYFRRQLREFYEYQAESEENAAPATLPAGNGKGQAAAGANGSGPSA
ncbi:MAG TPA: polysaccharide biosynthesis tyrosine autokinase [Phycisphaerae bacterium]|nr:polysaccharide biosynthesis tyrosine autokinase [Phycisphaerae bacterium]HNU43710.1 polysaccharide biosynthesis tyrosine autokinase [Phycisphaerae bacterium]